MNGLNTSESICMLHLLSALVGLLSYALLFPFLFHRLYLVRLPPLMLYWHPIVDAVFSHG